MLGLTCGVVIRLFTQESSLNTLNYSVLSSQSTGVLKRVTSMFYGQGKETHLNPTIGGGDLVTIVPGGFGDAQISRFVYILSDGRLQKWQLFKSSSESLLLDVDLNKILFDVIQEEIESHVKQLDVAIDGLDYAKYCLLI